MAKLRIISRGDGLLVADQVPGQPVKGVVSAVIQLHREGFATGQIELSAADLNLSNVEGRLFALVAGERYELVVPREGLSPDSPDV